MGGGEYIGHLDKSSLFKGFGVQIKGPDKYIGDFHKGEPSGLLNWYINDSLHYSGCWDRGRFHGTGTLYEEDGTIKKGKWESGAIVQTVVDVTSPNGHYVGNVTNGVQDGLGRMTYSNGISYEGEWKGGKWDGEGLYCNALDSVYGAWSNGKINGAAMYKTPKVYYEGTFIDGVPNGIGVLYDIYGSVYSGGWTNGERDGMGDMLFPNGDSYFGEWKNNQFDGTGKYVYAAANAEYQGEWKDGLQDGRGLYKCPECTYFGEWEKGWMDGNGTLQFKNGDIYEGTIHENLLAGIGRYQYENGNYYEGEFINGKINGLGVFQFKDGNRFEGEFFDGKIYGDGTLYICEKEDTLCITGFWPKDGGFPEQASILFANGDIYEGPLQDGLPTQEGLWISGEERRANIDKIERSILHKANELYKSHKKTIDKCLHTASMVLSAIEIASVVTGVGAPVAAVLHIVNTGIIAADSLMSTASATIDVKEAAQLGEDMFEATVRLAGELVVNAGLIFIPKALKGLTNGVKNVVQSAAVKSIMSGVTQKVSAIKIGGFGKVCKVSIGTSESGMRQVVSGFETMVKSNEFKGAARAFFSPKAQAPFREDVIKCLVDTINLRNQKFLQVGSFTDLRHNLVLFCSKNLTDIVGTVQMGFYHIIPANPKTSGCEEAKKIFERCFRSVNNGVNGIMLTQGAGFAEGDGYGLDTNSYEEIVTQKIVGVNDLYGDEPEEVMRQMIVEAIDDVKREIYKRSIQFEEEDGRIYTNLNVFNVSSASKQITSQIPVLRTR